jgi:predicted dithiol-disulfide oxidoreductase (DUF899 family)
MVEVTKNYELHSERGPIALIDLFEGRDQLIVHHFMWTYDLDEDGTEHPVTKVAQVARQPPTTSATSPVWGRRGQLSPRCRGHRLTTSPLSSAGWVGRSPGTARQESDFNYDFHVTVDDRVAPVLVNYRDQTELTEQGTPWSAAMRGDWPGVSAFLRQGDRVFHTYSTFARGIEQQSGMGTYLDLTALGRQEAWEQPPGRITGQRKMRVLFPVAGRRGAGPPTLLPTRNREPSWRPGACPPLPAHPAHGEGRPPFPELELRERRSRAERRAAGAARHSS